MPMYSFIRQGTGLYSPFFAFFELSLFSMAARCLPNSGQPLSIWPSSAHFKQRRSLLRRSISSGESFKVGSQNPFLLLLYLLLLNLLNDEGGLSVLVPISRTVELKTFPKLNE